MSTIKTGTTLTTAYQVEGDTTGALVIQTGATPTTAVTIDASQNVGIGTSSPTALGAGRTSVNINGTTDSILWLGSNGTYTGYVQGASAACNLVGNGVDLQLSANGAKTISFSTNGAERANIDSSGNFKMNSGYGSVATAYGCRAWVNFNGTGTVAINASGNVSSITDNGTGSYTVNFTTSMPDANYSIAGTARSNDGSTGRGRLEPHPTTTPTTSGVRVVTNSIQNVSAERDSPSVYVQIFR